MDRWTIDIHLSAFLEHKVFGKTKPPLTQTALQRALQSKGSELLEVRLCLVITMLCRTYTS